MDKLKISVDNTSIATDFMTELVFTLAEQHSISVSKVLSVFDELGYWKIVNDDDVCCVLSHDGALATAEDLKENFNEILSRNAGVL